MALFIRSDGYKCHIEPNNGTDFSLEELQGYVGGYIQIVAVDNLRVMVVDEEGLLLPINQTASNMIGQRIVGDVVVCLSKEIK